MILELVAAALLVALPLGSDWLFNSYYLDLATRIVIIWIALLGYDLLAGYSGLVSLGHAMYFGLAHTGPHGCSCTRPRLSHFCWWSA